MVRSMNRARSDAGAATLKGNIYVVGEFDEVAPTKAAEVFCPGTGRWSINYYTEVDRTTCWPFWRSRKVGFQIALRIFFLQQCLSKLFQFIQGM